MSPSDAQVVGGILVLVVIMVNFWIASRNRRVERADDAAQRAQDKLDLADRDAQIERKVGERATEIAKQLELQNENRRLREEISHAETLRHIAGATAAAKEAYTEANHVNIKIEKQGAATQALQVQLERTLAKIPDDSATHAAAAAAAAAGT